MPKYVFPKVDLPKVDRSNFSLDKSVFMSFAPSTIRVPWCKDVLPNDHWEIDLSAAIESLPMLSPMYGRWKARWAFFFEPYSNIYGFMDNNTRRSTEEIIKTHLLTYYLPLGSVVGTYGSRLAENGVQPMFYKFEEFTGNLPLHEWINRAQVSGSSIWCDLGWPQGWCGYPTTSVDMTPAFHAGNADNPLTLPSSDYSPTYPEIINDLFDNDDNYSWPTSYKSELLHAVKPFGYLDIIRNYYVNNQEKRIPYVGYTADVESFTNRIDFVDQDVLDYIMMYIRTVDFNVFDDSTLSGYFENGSPLLNYHIDAAELHQRATDFMKSWELSYFIPNGGTFLSSYSMDLNRGLMNAEQGNFQSYMTTDENGRISISQMYTANKIQEMINILDITGGRFSDWVNALWAVDIKGDIDKPIYLGSHTEFIATTDIVSPSTTDGSVAGQQTGFSAGGFGREFKKITFNSDQYGVVYCVFNMIPDVYYSTGFKREDLKQLFTDIYNPRMARIGYQDVPAKVLTALPDTGSVVAEVSKYITANGNYVGIQAPYASYLPWVASDYYLDDETTQPFLLMKDYYISGTYDPNEVVGRQVAWAEYMSDVDETRGYFALNGSLSYWTLNRSYKRAKSLNSSKNIIGINNDFEFAVGEFTHNVRDYSTYVIPSEWNNLFADTSPDAENFRMYLKFNVFVKRAIPSRSFPHL